jgi:methyl-accepting chemotaxis protein
MSKLPMAPLQQMDPDDGIEGSEDAKRIRFGLVSKTMVTMLAAGLLPLALFGGITLMQQGDRIRAEAERSMQANAERISAQVDEWFDKNVRVLQAASNLPAIASMHGEDQVKVLAAVQQAYPWMYLVFTVAPDGKNVARSDGKPLTDYSDRQYYKDVVGGKPLSWETLIGKTSNKPALVLALPIKVNGAVVGVIAAAMTIEDISAIVATWKAGQTGFAFLVDEKAKVIAHPREVFVLSQTHLDDHPLVAAFLSDRQAHLLSYTQTDGKQVLGYVHGNRNRWGLAVQQDEEELFAPVRRTLTLGLALLLTSAILVAGFALFFSKMLIRPIVEMARAADQMSLGELDRPIPSLRKDELGQLAMSLERLRRSMKAAIARLG